MLQSSPPIPRTSRWTAAAVAAISSLDQQLIAPVAPPAGPLLAGLDLWDMWPVQLADGTTARFGDNTLWMILSAPQLADPDQRHGIARIRLVSEQAGQWHDCGNLLPDGLNPGSREWAGTALYDPPSQRLTLFYTVAGHHDELRPSFAQRLFHTTGRLEWADGAPRVRDWAQPRETVVADGRDYVVVDQTEGAPGIIKGFRDPAIFAIPPMARPGWFLPARSASRPANGTAASASSAPMMPALIAGSCYRRWSAPMRSATSRNGRT